MQWFLKTNLFYDKQKKKKNILEMEIVLEPRFFFLKKKTAARLLLLAAYTFIISRHLSRRTRFLRGRGQSRAYADDVGDGGIHARRRNRRRHARKANQYQTKPLNENSDPSTHSIQSSPQLTRTTLKY